MGAGIAALLARMEEILEGLERDGDHGRHFLATYLRTTRAIGVAVEASDFEDPSWVEAWDVAFADLYLDALAAHRDEPASAPRPWRVAFAAAPDLPPEAHVLLGMNAHINYDLPQALLRMIPPAAFEDPAVLGRRQRDHHRIDDILVARVGAEDRELERAGGRRTRLDRMLAPANRWASRRLLREARRKVWHNTVALHEARCRGEAAYARRLVDLDVLSTARVADLLRPGPVLLRLGVLGFGVTLPPA